MKLIVGLGNPGSQYQNTRHNAGFMAIDLFAERTGAGNYRQAHESFMSDVNVAGEKILLMKPQTYMNLSGRAVASAMQFYKLAIDDLLVVVDDIAIPVGTIRLRASGSAGGHNGLKDVERALSSFAASAGKTGQEYARLRIGVDAPDGVRQVDYVLGTFTPDQRPLLQAALTAAIGAIELWTSQGINAAMNRFNKSDPPPPAPGGRAKP